MFSRNLLRSTAGALRTVAVRPANVKFIAPSFSTLLDKKELAEESKYIRTQEQKRQEEMKSRLEAILAHKDSEEKAHLMRFLG
jgi:crotonobetainyl-CoA:carnitine CoA-transferase CaiB-like acyl-CoA transferase